LNDQINSTERLLQIIRSTGEEKLVVHQPSPDPVSGGISLGRSTLFSQGLTVGVEIGEDALRLAIAGAGGEEGRGRIVEARSVPFDPRAPKGSPAFIHFLRDHVNSGSCSGKAFDVWTLIPASSVAIRNVLLPRMARKKVANGVYWALKREGGFDEQTEIIDFELNGEVMEKGVPKLCVLAYTAPRAIVQEIRSLFAEAGIKLKGVTSSHFALQNIFRTNWLRHGVTTVATLDIGSEGSRIDIFTGGNLSLTREIKTGTNSMIEALHDHLLQEASQSGLGMGRDVSGNDIPGGLALEPGVQARSLFSAMLREGGTKSGEPGAAIDQERSLEMIQPALERLVRQIERTLQHFTGTLGNERVEQIYLAGATGAERVLGQYIGAQLGTPTLALDPLDPDLLLPGPVPIPQQDRSSLAVTAGLALSGNERTPNLLFTYQDKEEQHRVVFLNRIVYGVFLATLMLLGLTAFWQNGSVGERIEELNRIEARLAAHEPRLNEPMLLKRAAEARQEHLLLKELGNRYEPVALLGELADLTSSDVSLLAVTLDLPQPRQEQATKGGGRKAVVVEGIVTGEVETLDAGLAGYLLKLRSSPLFEMPAVHKSEIEEYPGEGRVLRFILHVAVRGEES
jgi:type IV pilus assembly protein PilM